MTTPYIDPRLIFASDAPVQDKPARFDNYAKGMDETRKNDGRPTIKQFNFLQQQNDQKILYIHERGAALPYIEGFPYEENAPVIKDGILVQKKGDEWKPVGANKASDILDESGLTQQEWNNGVESVADLVLIQNPKDGNRVFVKQAVVGSGMGGGWFYYSETQTKTHDGFIVINHGTGQWQKITIAYPTVFDFGAVVGDTDSSAAFNACAASPYTGLKVITGDYTRYLTIASQVDLKGKDLVGAIKTTTDNSKFEKCSIYVVNGSFKSDEYAFINAGCLKNISIVDKTASLTLNCVSLKSMYGVSYDYVNIRGFNTQTYGVGGVFFIVKNSEFFNFKSSSFRFGATAQPSATCIDFDSVMFQWGNIPVVFDKELSGSTFRNVIFEYTNGGVKASAIYNCTFQNIWAEYTNDGAAHLWIESTQSQQITRNTYINIVTRGQFTNPASSDALGSSCGGNVLDGSGISVGGSTGAKVKLDSTGLSTRFDDWYGGTQRRLLITTQSRAENSNYYTPLYINAPTQRLFFGNQDETSAAPVVFNRVIGAGADGKTPFYSADTYTKVQRSWGTHDHVSNTVGKFYAPRMLTYRSRLTTQQVNSGYSVSRISTGVYRVQRVSETTAPLSNPHVQVSGVSSGSDRGDGTFVSHSLQFRDSYSGSWSNASECSGFDVVFRDSTDALKDVTNFTVSFSNS